MDRRKYKTKRFTAKGELDESIFNNIDFSGERKLIPPGEINEVLNVGEQFDLERERSKIYRFIFTISPLFSNPLMNVTSNNNWGPIGNNNNNTDGNSLSTLNNDIFKIDPYTDTFNYINNKYNNVYTYEESINKNLKEVNGWFGFNNPDFTSRDIKYYDMEPTRKRFDLNSNINKNWDFLLTYPSDIDKTHYVVDGGLLIVNGQSVNVGGKSMVALSTATNHGLNFNDNVTLTEMGNPLLNGTFNVEMLGLDDGSLKGNVFVINVDSNDVQGDLSPNFDNGRMRKNLNGQLSEYYLRKFSNMLLTKDDYEIYPLAFSNNIFNDQNYQLIINQDIDIADLKDNLGRPLSELYLTFIKRVDGNFFNNIDSGLDLEYLEGNLNNPKLSNVREIYNGSNTENLETNVNASATTFYGDLVEYNKLTIKEEVLSSVLHRFNTKNRESSSTLTTTQAAGGPRNEGYLYNPHHKVVIGRFSSYTELGPSGTTVGIPDYAEDLGDGRLLWRDYLPLGIPDGEGNVLDYPFLNGVNYIYENICFKTFRQDPFAVYGLYYFGGFDNNGNFDPPDPKGGNITDNFTINRGENAC